MRRQALPVTSHTVVCRDRFRPEDFYADVNYQGIYKLLLVEDTFIFIIVSHQINNASLGKHRSLFMYHGVRRITSPDCTGPTAIRS